MGVRWQVGACIVSKAQVILGIGYNGFPRGCPDSELPWAKLSRGGNPLETKYPYVCHAELNAILNKNTASLEGAVRTQAHVLLESTLPSACPAECLLTEGPEAHNQTFTKAVLSSRKTACQVSEAVLCLPCATRCIFLHHAHQATFRSLCPQKMYVTMFPCNECSKLLIQAGIKEVVFYEDKAVPVRGTSPNEGSTVR